MPLYISACFMLVLATKCFCIVCNYKDEIMNLNAYKLVVVWVCDLVLGHGLERYGLIVGLEQSYCWF